MPLIAAQRARTCSRTVLPASFRKILPGNRVDRILA
jgi:hypothetical protein